MKATYANGVLTAFEQAGYHPWDGVYGTSAGGALAAWYSARQAEYAEQTWDYAADPRILSYRRALLRRGPLLDHEALLRIVYEQEHPINQEAIRRCRWPVVVTAVDIHTGRCVYKDLREGNVIAWLKATGRLPFASGPPVPIDGHQYLDGGVVDPIPIRHVVEEAGATDITLILNKPPGPKKPDPRFVLELAARRYPLLRDGIVHHQRIKYESTQYALNPPEGVTIRIIHPSKDTGLGRLTRDLEALRATIAWGRQDGRAFLGKLEAAAS